MSIRTFSLSSGVLQLFLGNTDTTRMILPWESCVRSRRMVSLLSLGNGDLICKVFLLLVTGGRFGNLTEPSRGAFDDFPPKCPVSGARLGGVGGELTMRATGRLPRPHRGRFWRSRLLLCVMLIHCGCPLLRQMVSNNLDSSCPG